MRNSGYTKKLYCLILVDTPARHWYLEQQRQYLYRQTEALIRSGFQILGTPSLQSDRLVRF